MKNFINAIVFIFISIYGFSQSTDVLRLEYTTLPEGTSEVRTSRYRFLANVPIKLDDDKFLVAGGEYSFIDFDSELIFPFDDSEIERFKVIDFNLGYIFRWNPSWLFAAVATPRWASNFTGKAINEDLKLNFAAFMIKENKDAEKPTRLILGLTYNSATGFPIPLPLINYYKKFHPNWSYTLGVPRMDLKYHIKDKHTFKTALLLDGYFVNVQNNVVLPDNDLGSGLSLSVVVGALGYQYNLGKNVSLYTLMGHTLSQSGILRDDKRKKVFSLYKEGNVYFRTGFKIGIF